MLIQAQKLQATSEVPGTLHMKIMQGHLYRSSQTFDQMDPFLVIECEGFSYKTKIHENGGMAPKWNQLITLSLRSIK